MDKVKVIEGLLFEYREIPHKIRRNEIEIKMIEKSFDDISRGNNQIKESTPTYSITSSVENALTNKETKIERLKEEIEDMLLQKSMIENAYSILSKDEKGIIATRYFDRVPVSRMANNLDMTEDAIYKACKRIIENKLSKYIVIQEENEREIV